MRIEIEIRDDKAKAFLKRFGQVFNFTAREQDGKNYIEVDADNPYSFCGGVKRKLNLTDEDKMLIAIKHYERGESYMSLSKEYSISVSSVRRICDSERSNYE